MKKILLATTLLAAGAGMAAADVTISGYGRFGLQYVENRGDVAVFDGEELVGFEARDTVISSRLRLNIDATKETDVGVTFGARLRLQYDDGDNTVQGNAAKFTVAYEGLTVGVGNVDTAFDSVKLTYDSEMGYEDSSYGDAQSNFFAYNSKGSTLAQAANELLDGDMPNGYQGISATYSFGDINTYFSYVNPNQYISNADISEEVGIAADWTNGQISVAASYVANGAGIKGNDLAFLGAAYSFGDAAVGLNLYDNGDLSNGTGDDLGTQVTLYGNYKFGDTTVKAYVSDVNIDNTNTDVAYGIGADYSLGEGVRISGALQSGFEDGASAADLGVRFDF